MVVLWGALTAVAPSFAWCAVPVAFAVLRVLPFGWAVGTVVAMTALLTAAWQRITDGFDPVQVVGPVGVALVTVVAFRALDLESRARLDLVDQLVDAQDALAEQQHRTGDAAHQRERAQPEDPGALAGELRPQAEVVAVDGAKHLWVGDTERVLDEIVARLNPAVPLPLPTEWDGPMERADSSAYADRTTAIFKDTPR